MATTTNYGWTTPDDTALVKDGASAIRTLGSSVDTTTKNLNPETTLGDIAYRSSTANVKTRLGIGTTGQILTVAGGVPSWATPAGGSKVVQIVSMEYNTEVATTSAAVTDTGVTATITPTSASNKVLIFLNQNGVGKTGNTYVQLRLSGTAGGSKLLPRINDTDGTNVAIRGSSVGFTYLDSPATTSAVTYYTTMQNANATGTAYVQFDGSRSSITLMEVTP